MPTTAKKAGPIKKAAPVKRPTAKKTPAKKATPAKAAPAKKATAPKAPTTKPNTTVQPALSLDAGELKHIATDKLIPDPANLRRGVGDKQEFEELVVSVGQVGILQPLLVVPHPTVKGSYSITAGFRRWSAASRVGLKQLPALVRDLSEDERTEAMLIENCRRTNLTPLEEAGGFQALLDRPGWTQRKVAQRVGCDQGHVSRRVSLLALPAKAQQALESEKIKITDALELVKIADEPKAVETIVGNVTRRDGYYDGGSVAQQVSSYDRERKDAAAIAELRAEQERLGTNVLGVHAAYGGAPRDFNGAKPLTEVFGWDLDTKTKNAHTKEPCHGVVICNTYDKPKVEHYCTDPKRHAKKGDSGVKLPDKRQQAEARVTPAQRAEREATDLRRTFVRQVLTTRNPARASVIDLALHRYIDDASTDERQKMANVLDLEPVQRPDPYDKNGKMFKDWQATIDQYIDASESNLLRSCLAFALVQGEWGYTDRVEHLAVLRSLGYELHSSEEMQYGKDLEELNLAPATPVVVADELDLAMPAKHQYQDQASALCKVCDLSAGSACHWTDDRSDPIRDAEQPQLGTISDALDVIDEIVQADVARAEELGLQPGDSIDEDGVITRSDDVDDIEAGAPSRLVCKDCERPVHFVLPDGTDPDDHGGNVHTDDNTRTCVDGRSIVARTQVLETVEA